MFSIIGDGLLSAANAPLEAANQRFIVAVNTLIEIAELSSHLRPQESKRLKQDSAASAAASTSTSTSASADKPATAVVESDPFTEQNVTDLMKYGFPRDKCIAELRESGGDTTKATAALFAKSLKGP